MPSKIVGAERAARSASRMSNERSAGELRPRNGEGERNRTVVSDLPRPSHTAGLLNHTRKTGVPSRTLTSNLTLRTRPLCALSYGDKESNSWPVSSTDLHPALSGSAGPLELLRFQEFEMVRASGNAPEPGTDLVR